MTTSINAALSQQTEFHISRPDARSPWILWGGAFPSGSLKYLTFERHLAQLSVTSSRTAGGLVEMSDGSSALALDLLGRQRGLRTTVACSAAGRKHLVSRGFQGDLVVCETLSEAFVYCQQMAAAGWIWPRQMTNRALIECVESWARELAECLARRKIVLREMVTGFGTGATAVGLHRTFAGSGIQIIALENRRDQAIHGWRHFESQNLGPDDLFHPFIDEVVRYQFSGTNPGPLEALLNAPGQAEPSERLIVSHDLLPAAAVRDLPQTQSNAY